MEKQVQEDCETLRKLLKSKGDNLIEFIVSKTKNDRQLLREGYKGLWGVDLEKEIDKNLSHNFKKTVLALFKRRYEFDAECLFKSMKGLGTDEDTLIEILCTRSSSDIQEIKQEFEKLYPKYSLEKWVSSETSGAFKKLLVSIIQCKRSDNSEPDESECEQLAKDLYEAGEKKLGTDEPVFNKIFAISSPAELVSICNHYNEISKNTLQTAIDKEYSGHIKDALKTIVEYAVNPAEYFAKKIKKAVKGLGTDDTSLIRVLVSREEIDIVDIRKKYKELYGKDMAEDIKGDTSGDYQKILVAITNAF